MNNYFTFVCFDFMVLGLNSALCACKAGILPLEPFLQATIPLLNAYISKMLNLVCIHNFIVNRSFLLKYINSMTMPKS
jgi:hypothetical protein